MGKDNFQTQSSKARPRCPGTINLTSISITPSDVAAAPGKVDATGKDTREPLFAPAISLTCTSAEPPSATRGRLEGGEKPRTSSEELYAAAATGAAREG